jgi:hypothetical protein
MIKNPHRNQPTSEYGQIYKFCHGAAVRGRKSNIPA